MCVVVIAQDAGPDLALVVAGNRDELHERASAPVARWDDRSGLIGGRDLVSGGAWLAVSETGRFGVVTNRRSDRPADPQARSRGLLLTDILTEAGDEALAGMGACNPVNLGIIRDGRAEIASNWPTTRRRGADEGLFGLSNGDIDEASTRVEALKGRMADWLAHPGDPEDLFAALRDETPTEATPQDSVFGAAPLFMHHPVYGTRCSTLVMVDRQGRGTVLERSYDAAGRAISDARVAFTWPPI